MKLLESGQDASAGAWLDPYDLDVLMTGSLWGGAALLITGPHVVASITHGDHLPLLELAGTHHRCDRETTDTDVFARQFTKHDIGLLYVNAGPTKVGVEFDVPDEHPLRMSDDIDVPDIPNESLELIVNHVRAHAGMRRAFPRGMAVRLHFRNYKDEILAGGWVYENRAFRHYASERSLCAELWHRRMMH
jgi:hypothetical protein